MHFTPEEIRTHGVVLCSIVNDLRERRGKAISFRPNYNSGLSGLSIPSMAVGFLDPELASNYHEIARLYLDFKSSDILRLHIVNPTVLKKYLELGEIDGSYTRQYELTDQECFESLDNSIGLLYIAWRTVTQGRT